MKKRRKLVPRILLAAVALMAAAGFAYAYPMLVMSPTPTGPVGDSGILALNAGLNSLYFVPLEDGYMLVDAGSSVDKVAQGLDEIGVERSQVRQILLTHSDYDHVASLALFPDAQVFMSANERQMVDGTTRRNDFSHNSLPEDVGADIRLLENGEVIEVGGSVIVCIAAPGHTPGSAAYLVDGRFLFTGDAFQVSNGAMSVHPYTMDSGLAQESIRTLAGGMEGVELVLTAHYGEHIPSVLR